MAPGGSACKEVESYPAVADYAIATTKPESNSMTTKSAFGVAGKHGIHSNNGVYELLECPVCKNLMYPPIHQVRSGSSVEMYFCALYSLFFLLLNFLNYLTMNAKICAFICLYDDICMLG